MKGGPVSLKGDTSDSVTVSVPSDAGDTTIHVILEMHDDGSPNLYAYRRVLLACSDSESVYVGATTEPLERAAWCQSLKQVAVTCRLYWLRRRRELDDVASGLPVEIH